MDRDPVRDFQRSAVRDRAHGCCEYCRFPERYAPDPFSVDHIHPRQHGGRTELDNLAFACLGCNHAKHARLEAEDPATGRTAPLFHPRRLRWNEHFAWSDDLSRIVRKTPTGRATVVALRLNREGLVNIRRALLAVAAHPPDLPDEG